MRPFRDWLAVRLDEESREERAAREEEARRREKSTLDHEFDRTHLHPPRPRGLDQRELLAWTMKNKPPQRPLSAYVDEVDMEMNRRLASTGSPRTEQLFFDNPSPRSEADFERLHDIVADSFRDGTSVGQAADMGMEFLRARGYIQARTT